MPPRPSLPADDLYARLELPVDASFETIEIAWRALLKQHHPDVAGPEALERAKRINVAHDWLSDPDLRDRYDRERHPAAAARPGRRDRRGSASTRPDMRPRAAAPPRPPSPRDPAVQLDQFIDRVGRLTAVELARLSVAEAPSIAFAASIRRFLSAERVAALADAEARVRATLVPEAWSVLPIRDAILSAAHELVLGEFLDEHLSEPFRGRARDRLMRSWEAAILQPRYGPNTDAVTRFLGRVGRLTEVEARALARSAQPSPGDAPWPAGIDPAEDEVFRVSSALAQKDAAAAADGRLGRLGIRDRNVAVRLRRILGATAHAIVLRHAFTAAEFARLVAPWMAVTGDPGTGRTGTRSGPGEPEVRRRT